jgi:hypothetical protein
MAASCAPENLNSDGGSMSMTIKHERVFAMSNGRLLGVVLALSPLASMADSGPIIPCNACATPGHFFEPRAGLWYNPQQPGSGLVLEKQGDLLLGSLFAYAADGKAQWYTFSGPLQKRESPFALTLTAPLVRYEDGMCVNCAYSPPDAIEDAGSIALEFTQHSYGSYSVAGGERNFIVPALLGIAAAADFGERAGGYRFPELEGKWTFAFHSPEIDRVAGRDLLADTSSIMLDVTEKGITTDAQGQPRLLVYGFAEHLRYTSTTDEALVRGMLRCDSDLEGGIRQPPICEIRLRLRFPGYSDYETLTFPIPYANIGATQLHAVDPETGMRLQAIRVAFE